MKFLIGLLVGVMLALQVGAGAESSETLRSRVRRLELKTKGLNTYGDLEPNHILVPFQCSGDPAVWTTNEQGADC